MKGFDFAHRPRIVFGPGSSARIGELTSARTALLVSDPGVAAAGHTDAVASGLREHRIRVHVFTDVRENPTIADVSACAAVASQHAPDLVIGLGGGSSLDVAKACAMVCAEGIDIARRPGMTASAQPHIPMIAIPTTAGTEIIRIVEDRWQAGDKQAECLPGQHLRQRVPCLGHPDLDRVHDRVETAVGRDSARLRHRQHRVEDRHRG